MAEDLKRSNLRKARRIYILSIVLIFILILVAVYLQLIGFDLGHYSDQLFVNYIIWILSIISLISVVLGLTINRWFNAITKDRSWVQNQVLTVAIQRISFLIAPASFGMVLRIFFGATWYIWAPFFGGAHFIIVNISCKKVIQSTFRGTGQNRLFIGASFGAEFLWGIGPRSVSE